VSRPSSCEAVKVVLLDTSGGLRVVFEIVSITLSHLRFNCDPRLGKLEDYANQQQLIYAKD
jgi:hypothetical protein